MNKTLRLKDREEAENQGVAPHKALYQSYKSAVYRKTVLVDDVVAAMFGVSGDLFATTNSVYFLTGTKIDTLPKITFVRLYLQELEKMTSMFNLVCLVDSKYKEAWRLVELAGFKRTKDIMINNNLSYMYGSI